MPEQETEQEPSIEEILTSIRQIISDDDEENGDENTDEDTADSEETPAEEATPEPQEEAPEEEAIELTEKLDDPEPVEPPQAEIEEPEAEPEEEPMPETESIEVEMQDIETEAPDVDDSLLSDTAEDAAFDAFSELAKKTAVEHGGITIEEIVRSELRPLLKGWLDKNLPNIIERLVQEELERVAKRAMDE